MKKQKRTQSQTQQDDMEFALSTCDVNKVKPQNTTQWLADNNATAIVYTTGCQASRGEEGEQPPPSSPPPSSTAKRESSGHGVSEKVEDTAMVDATAYQAFRGEEGEPLALSTSPPASLPITEELNTEDPSETASEHLSTKQTFEIKQASSETGWSGGIQPTPEGLAEGLARATQPEMVFVASEATDSFPLD